MSFYRRYVQLLVKDTALLSLATSRGKVANVSIKVGDELFRSRAIAAPGEQMEWTALLRIDMKDRDMLTKVNTMIT